MSMVFRYIMLQILSIIILNYSFVSKLSKSKDIVKIRKRNIFISLVRSTTFGADIRDI